MTDNFPKTHIGLTRRTWKRIRAGLRRCMTDDEDRRQCILWCRKFPDHTRAWLEILQGSHQDSITEALQTEDYFQMRPEAMIWWERILQNHPFAAIFAKENYAALLDKRKQKK